MSNSRKDNANDNKTDNPGFGVRWKEFYETSLPVTEMLNWSSNTPPSNQKVFFNQAYKSDTRTEKRPYLFKNESPDNITNTKDLYLFNEVTGKSVYGSNGNFIDNEVFYRLCLLKKKLGGNVPIGQISVPLVYGTNNTFENIQSIVDEVKNLIFNSLIVI